MWGVRIIVQQYLNMRYGLNEGKERLNGTKQIKNIHYEIEPRWYFALILDRLDNPNFAMAEVGDP